MRPMNRGALADNTCPACGHVHTNGDAIAVGRFTGTRGYRARSGGPLRETRDEAERDECRLRQGSGVGA